MPTYVARCDTHGDVETWRSMHDDSPLTCPTCDGPALKVMTPPNISVRALPNKGAQAKYAMDREARFDKDAPAYKRLRREGLQPKSIERCARIEQGAETRLEVEMGRRIPADRRSEALEVHQELNEKRPGVTEQVGDVVRGKRKEITVG